MANHIIENNSLLGATLYIVSDAGQIINKVGLSLNEYKKLMDDERTQFKPVITEYYKPSE